MEAGSRNEGAGRSRGLSVQQRQAVSRLLSLPRVRVTTGSLISVLAFRRLVQVRELALRACSVPGGCACPERVHIDGTARTEVE